MYPGEAVLPEVSKHDPKPLMRHLIPALKHTDQFHLITTRCHCLRFMESIHIDYRCADKRKVGELRGDIGAIR
jgi:hypothetical protein